MTTTGTRRGRMQRQSGAHERYEVTPLPCASCGKTLIYVHPVTGDPYFVCGVRDRFGGIAQRCPGLRREDGSVIPPEPPI